MLKGRNVLNYFAQLGLNDNSQLQAVNYVFLEK